MYKFIFYCVSYGIKVNELQDSAEYIRPYRSWHNKVEGGKQGFDFKLSCLLFIFYRKWRNNEA